MRLGAASGIPATIWWGAATPPGTHAASRNLVTEWPVLVRLIGCPKGAEIKERVKD